MRSNLAIVPEDPVEANSTDWCRRLEMENGRLSLLLDLTNTLASNQDLQELLPAIAKSLRNRIGRDGGIMVTVPDEQSGQHRVYIADLPENHGFVSEELLIPHQGPSGRAFETLQPVIVRDEDVGHADHVGSLSAAQAVETNTRCICFVPIVSGRRALGLLGFASSDEKSFTEDEAEFLRTVGVQLGIAIENTLAHREISELKGRLAQESLYIDEETGSEIVFEQIVGKSQALKHVLNLVNTVATSDSTVLLLGETGTGKELIARAIRDHSKRKQAPFVKLNCAAIPAGLVESELFGHEKGAFTGAINQKIGRLEFADQGTLFLDEVGDIPMDIQPKLLHALQEREFERVGSAQTRKVNVRLIAATNRDIEKMIASREFRSDLYYRLNVFPIHVPPLRDRKEDIPLLVRYFVQRFAREMQKPIETIPAATLKRLTDWDWPGNIRELENFMERAVILTRGRTLAAPLGELRRSRSEGNSQHISHNTREEIAGIVRDTISELSNQVRKQHASERLEKQREQIVAALRESQGRVGGHDGAAARIGVNRTTLLSRMKKLGIGSRPVS